LAAAAMMAAECIGPFVGPKRPPQDDTELKSKIPTSGKVGQKWGTHF